MLERLVDSCRNQSGGYRSIVSHDECGKFLGKRLSRCTRKPRLLSHAQNNLCSAVSQALFDDTPGRWLQGGPTEVGGDVPVPSQRTPRNRCAIAREAFPTCPAGMPLQAIRLVRWRRRSARRHLGWSLALSACSLWGGRRRSRGGVRMPETRSSRDSTSILFCRLAPVGHPASGVPCRSVISWGLVTGMLPVSGIRADRRVIAPFTGQLRAFDTRPPPVDPLGLAELVELRSVVPIEGADPLPVAQVAPTGDASPAARIDRQLASGKPGPQDRHEASEGRTV